MITLERLKQLLIFDEATSEFRWSIKHGKCRAGEIAGSTRDDGYKTVVLDYRRYLIHRLVWLWAYGEFPTALIDHIDGNPSNNRLDNLRSASRSQNMMNQSSGKDGHVTGVCFDKSRGKWMAYITVGGKHVSLGRYDDQISAAKARAEASVSYHGQYAPSSSKAMATRHGQCDEILFSAAIDAYRAQCGLSGLRPDGLAAAIVAVKNTIMRGKK